MVSPLFTAFALIAAGRADVPAAPPQPAMTPEIRGIVPERAPKADRSRVRR
jgi:hypothetical protein